MDSGHRLKRIRWLCRRGMKELDVLLENFIARSEDAIGRGAWPELEDLLQCEDDLIWDWLQQPDLPDAAAYYPLLVDIRYGSAAST